MINHNIEQNTDEWLALRIGKFTASIAADLLMDKTTKGYQNLIAKITEERFTGQACESKAFQGNAFTDRGHSLEAVALIDYSTKYFYDTHPMGFVESDNHLYGCSPDDLINEDGQIQVKSPIFATQRKYLEIVKKHKDLTPNELMQKIDGRYYKQCQMELFVTEREYNVFYSFHPMLKEVMLKLERDETLIKQIDLAIKEATKYIDIELIKLERK